MLERESLAAWEERKRKGLGSGEAAATKLLFPMVLMLFGGHGDHYDSGISLILWRNLNTKKQLELEGQDEKTEENLE